VRAIIGAKLLPSKEAQAGPRPFEIRDTRLRGFILRVQASGARSYYAQHGRGRRTLIGAVGHYTPDEARERCAKILGNVAHDRHPLFGLDGANSLTLGEFIGEDGVTVEHTTYRAWLKANRPKSAERTLQRLSTCFKSWYTQPLTDITVERIEKWRRHRHQGAAQGAEARRTTPPRGAQVLRGHPRANRFGRRLHHRSADAVMHTRNTRESLIEGLGFGCRHGYRSPDRDREVSRGGGSSIVKFTLSGQARLTSTPYAVTECRAR
jgi:hypothetical protein